MKHLIRDIFDLLRGSHERLPLLIVLVIVSGGLDLVGLGLLGQYISALMGSSPTIEIGIDRWFGLSSLDGRVKAQAFGVLLIAVFLAKTALGIFTNYLVNGSIGRIEAKIRADLLLGYQLMPYQLWASRNTSEYINAINVWVVQFTRSIVIPLIRLASDCFVALLILIFFAYLDWRVFGIFLVLLSSVGLLYDRVVREKISLYGDRFRKVSVDVVSDVRHAMDGLKEIRVLGAEKYFNDRIRTNATHLCATLASLNTYSQVPRYLIELTMIGFAVGTVGIIAAIGETTEALIPVFGVFAAGAVRLAPLLSLTSSVMTNIRFYRDMVKTLADDYRMVQTSQCRGERGRVSDFADKFEKLETDNMWFKYDQSEDWALTNVNIEIRAGETVAFVGQSGAGKTTLVDILLGLLEPTKGTVKVNGVAREHSSSLLRGKVAYLPQNVFMIDDTLRRNVALGEPDIAIDDKKVLEALRRAELIEFVNELPNRLDEVLGDRGVRFSGGQRERVALARAFYFEREILVLDEATSAIDEDTERAIVDEIMGLRGEKTLIVITHRPAVARRCERVYCIRDGEVVREAPESLSAKH